MIRDSKYWQDFDKSFSGGYLETYDRIFSEEARDNKVDYERIAAVSSPVRSSPAMSIESTILE